MHRSGGMPVACKQRWIYSLKAPSEQQGQGLRDLPPGRKPAGRLFENQPAALMRHLLADPPMNLGLSSCGWIRPTVQCDRRCAPSRSRMLSATVGSPICACHFSTGNWLVRMVERRL